MLVECLNYILNTRFIIISKEEVVLCQKFKGQNLGVLSDLGHWTYPLHVVDDATRKNSDGFFLDFNIFLR